MNRYRGKFQTASFLAAALVLILSACGDAPTTPGPPQSPPRPVTASAHISTAQMDLSVRPAPPPPSEM